MDSRKIITRIEDLDKKRSKIYVNHEFAFVLYKGELSDFRLKEHAEITSADYDAIQNQLLPKRAKKRSLNLLQKRNYTEAGLREKLEEGYYTPQIIDDAIEYVKSYHYIDDYEFACQYIFYHKDSESKRIIEEKLRRKGVGKETLEKALEDSYEEEELQQLEFKQANKLLQKKHYDPELMEYREKQKIYQYLLRKGIPSSTAKKAMVLSFEESD